MKKNPKIKCRWKNNFHKYKEKPENITLFHCFHDDLHVKNIKSEKKLENPKHSTKE
jgi:hypothetical protein